MAAAVRHVPACTTEDKMAKHGKKYMAALAKVDLDKEYSTARSSCAREGNQHYQVRFNSGSSSAHRA